MTDPSRRAVLAGVLAAGGLGLPRPSPAQELAVTPNCPAEGYATPAQTEGRSFRAGSPGRDDLVEPGSNAQVIELSGFVLTRLCNPVARAVVDIWHADERGAYDNAGFRYRGRVYTDETGRWRLRTIVPGFYTGRTRHYHANVAAGGRLLLTTQLYFPDEPANRSDGLFRKELVLQLRKATGGLAGRYDFVIDLPA